MNGGDQSDPTGVTRTLINAVLLAVLLGLAALLASWGAGADLETALRDAAAAAAGALLAAAGTAAIVRRTAYSPATVEQLTAPQPPTPTNEEK